jgi:Cu/Ag efflux pump CusA
MRTDDPDFDDRALFFHILKEAVSNVLWYGAATIVIFLVAVFLWRWLAISLFAIFALIMVFSIFQAVGSVVLSIVSIPLSIYEKLKGRSGRAREQFWLNAASIVQALELFVLGNYCFWLFRVLFKRA